MSEVLDVRRGTIAWADLDPTRGREQAGRRPVLVVSSDGYNASVPNIVMVVPLTTRDRGLPHHVLVRGEGREMPQVSYAMTEQVRTIDRQRLAAVVGIADVATMSAVDSWFRDFLAL